MNTESLQWYQSLEHDDDYWVESAKVDFAVAMERLMKQRNIRKKDIAEQLHTSPAYITKVMRGDVNLTIESMVKLSRAVDGDLHIHIAPKAAKVRWAEVIRCQEPAQQESKWISTNSWVSKARAGRHERITIAA